MIDGHRHQIFGHCQDCASRPQRAPRARGAAGRGEARADRGPRGCGCRCVHPFETSFGRTEVKEFLLVAVTADGVTGYGECVADVDPFYLPETNDTALHVLRDFLVPLAFARAFDASPRPLAAFARVRGHEMAKAALEMAVWELAARREARPLYALLGGRGGEIAAGVSIGMQPDDAALVDSVAAEAAAGYRRIKIKIKPGRDRALGGGGRGASRPAADGRREQRLHAGRRRPLRGAGRPRPDDGRAAARLGRHRRPRRAAERIRTPVCLDESIRSADDARHALDLGACRIVNIKVGRVGGFAAASPSTTSAVARGVPVWCGGMLESGIGRLANVHLQTLPGFMLPGDTSAERALLRGGPGRPAGRGLAARDDRGSRAARIGHDVVWPRVERATLAREVFGRP